MIPPGVRSILEILLRKSEEGYVNWISADELGIQVGQEEAYSVVTPDATISLWKENKGVIHGDILNSRGSVITEFDSMDSQDDHQLLSELLSLARRKPLKVDETLEDIKSYLENSEIVGAVPKTLGVRKSPFSKRDISK